MKTSFGVRNGRHEEATSYGHVEKTRGTIASSFIVNGLSDKNFRCSENTKNINVNGVFRVWRGSHNIGGSDTKMPALMVY